MKIAIYTLLALINFYFGVIGADIGVAQIISLLAAGWCFAFVFFITAKGEI
jgi:hypothetical protein